MLTTLPKPGPSIGESYNNAPTSSILDVRAHSEPTIDWLKSKFGKKPEIFDANVATLKAGYYFGDTSELFQETYTIQKASIESGTYRNITGNQSTSLGFIAASEMKPENAWVILSSLSLCLQ